MKKIWHILAAALFAVACTPTDGGTEEASLEVSPSQLTFGAEDTAPQEITVTAVGVEWEYSVPSTADWITVDDGTAGKLLVSVAANPAAEARTASITVRPTNNGDVKAKTVTVKQDGNPDAGTGGEPGTYSLTVDPALLTFGAEGAAPQEVTVTTEGEGLTWSTAVDADWIAVTEQAGGFTVSVTDNPETTERAANITVMPSESSASPKAVRVVQEGKVLPPSLTLSYNGGPLPEEGFSMAYNDRIPRYINVEAVNVEWNVSVSYEGNQTGWLNATKVEDKRQGDQVVIQVADESNISASPRSCVVRITTDVEGIGPFEVKVTQEGKPEFDSTLAEDVDFGTLTEARIMLNYTRDEWGQTYALWTFEFWDEGLTYNPNNGQWSGSGDRLMVYLATEPVYQNDDNEYYLPDGTYTVVEADFAMDPSSRVPGNISCGVKIESNNSRRNTWYLRMGDGAVKDDARIVSGTMEVKRTGETYDITFDFGSDALCSVTGSFQGSFDDITAY